MKARTPSEAGARQARHGPADPAAGPAGAGSVVGECSYVVPRPAGARRKCRQGSNRAVCGRIERPAHHPRRAERRLFVAETSAGRIRVRAQRWRGQGRRQRDIRRRPSCAVRHRVLSQRRRPTMGLCRQRRQRRALSLSFRRPESRRPAETIVAKLRPAGTRPAILPSRRTTSACWYRSAPRSNIGDGMGKPPGGLEPGAASTLGAAWGEETDRAAVLAFDPDGKKKQLLRHRHPQLRRPRDPARHRDALVLDQRARRARRRPRARLCHARQGRRVLRLAVALYRRPRGPAPSPVSGPT